MNFEKLRGKKREFVLCYLKTNSVTKAARSVGVSEAACYRWLAGGLREEINKYQDEFFNAAIDKLRGAAVQVSEELVDIITNPASPPLAKIRAAELFFDILSRQRDESNILARLNALEKY